MHNSIQSATRKIPILMCVLFVCDTPLGQNCQVFRAGGCSDVVSWALILCSRPVVGSYHHFRGIFSLPPQCQTDKGDDADCNLVVLNTAIPVHRSFQLRPSSNYSVPSWILLATSSTSQIWPHAYPTCVHPDDGDAMILRNVCIQI